MQKPHPPLWFGAHHPNALRRAVELGDGFMGAGSLSTARFADEVKLLRGLLSDAKRDPAAFPIAKRVYIAVDRDKARAGKRLTEWFGGFYGRPQMAEEVSIWASQQTGLHINCRQGVGTGIPWGLAEVSFQADDQTAHEVLKPLIRLEQANSQSSKADTRLSIIGPSVLTGPAHRGAS